MKKSFSRFRTEFIAILVLALCISGMQFQFSSLSKLDLPTKDFPLFLLACGLLALYLIPFIFLTNYLKKRFHIPQPIIIISWLFGLLIPANIGSLGNDGLSYILLTLDPKRYILNDWGASLTAPFAEEIGKGLVVLLVFLLFRKLSLKAGLVVGMIAGMGFQLSEDIYYLSQAAINKEQNVFSMAFERIASSGVSHWVFTAIFSLGLLALVSKSNLISKQKAILFLLAPVALHFLWNSPLDFTGIETFYGTLNWIVLLLAFKTVDQLPDDKEEAIK